MQILLSIIEQPEKLQNQQISTGFPSESLFLTEIKFPNKIESSSV